MSNSWAGDALLSRDAIVLAAVVSAIAIELVFACVGIAIARLLKGGCRGSDTRCGG